MKNCLFKIGFNIPVSCLDVGGILLQLIKLQLSLLKFHLLVVYTKHILCAQSAVLCNGDCLQSNERASDEQALGIG